MQMLATAGAGRAVGGREARGAGEAAGATFYTTVNTPVEWREFTFMVQEALREI